MRAAEDNLHQSAPADPLAGYVVSVGLALLASGWLAAPVALEAARRFGLILPAGGVAAIETGLFLAIAWANPVGVLVASHRPGWAALRFGLGLAAGHLLQDGLLTPLAGPSVSKYLLLFVAALAWPAVLLYRRLGGLLTRAGIDPAARLLALLRRVLGLPERLLFLLFAAMALTLAGVTGAGAGPVLAVEGGLLVLLRWAVSRETSPGAGPGASALDDELRLWLELDPATEQADPAEELRREVSARLRHLGLSVLPAAILLGTMTYLAIGFVGLIYPDLGAGPAAGAVGLGQGAIALAGALAVILFGMLAAFGAGKVLLRVIARWRSWGESQLHDSCTRLARLLHIRQIRTP